MCVMWKVRSSAVLFDPVPLFYLSLCLSQCVTNSNRFSNVASDISTCTHTHTHTEKLSYPSPSPQCYAGWLPLPDCKFQTFQLAYPPLGWDFQSQSSTSEVSNLKHSVCIDLHNRASTSIFLKFGSCLVRLCSHSGFPVVFGVLQGSVLTVLALPVWQFSCIMGAVMAALSVEARRRLSRPSCLSHCGHSAARYHRSGRRLCSFPSTSLSVFSFTLLIHSITIFLCLSFSHSCFF